MQYLGLARLRDELSTADQARVGALFAEEKRRAKQLYAEGRVRQIWETEDGVALIFEASSVDEVREMVNSFPMVSAGLLETTVLALRPYSNFGPEGI